MWFIVFSPLRLVPVLTVLHTSDNLQIKQCQQVGSESEVVRTIHGTEARIVIR